MAEGTREEADLSGAAGAGVAAGTADIFANDEGSDVVAAAMASGPSTSAAIPSAAIPGLDVIPTADVDAGFASTAVADDDSGISVTDGSGAVAAEEGVEPAVGEDVASESDAAPSEDDGDATEEDVAADGGASEESFKVDEAVAPDEDAASSETDFDETETTPAEAASDSQPDRPRRPTLSRGATTAIFAVVAVVVFALDRATKIWAEANLADGPLDFVPGFMNFVLVHNKGASFGSFQGATIPLLVMTAVICVLLIVYVFHWKRHRIYETIASGAVFAGALGNALDRILYGQVTDFMNFQFFDFPVFNVADCGITIGIAVLLVFIVASKDSPLLEDIPSKNGEGEDEDEVEGEDLLPSEEAVSGDSDEMDALATAVDEYAAETDSVTAVDESTAPVVDSEPAPAPALDAAGAADAAPAPVTVEERAQACESAAAPGTATETAAPAPDSADAAPASAAPDSADVATSTLAGESATSDAETASGADNERRA